MIKLRKGEYTSMQRHIDIGETLEMRASAILSTAEMFRPDMFIVDKEPIGLRGEVEETLAYLKARGTTLVLGLRDVMDAPQLLDAEWKRNDLMRKIGTFYDMIWVYGPPDFYDPLAGLEVPAAVRARMKFVGFLQRSLPRTEGPDHCPKGDYILVTTGGGGDGADLVEQVIDAYHEDPGLSHRALIVLGPYMPAKKRWRLSRKAAGIQLIQMIEFDNRMEELIAGARAVVAMGGYNTYCEILSFDKPALIVPRLEPRQEQFIRARRAAELGLVQLVLPEEADDAPSFAAALSALPDRAPPSRTNPDLRLLGLDHISDIVEDWFDQSSRRHLSLVQR